MVSIVWLIPLLPLLGFTILVFFGKRIGEPIAGWLATAMMGLSFVVALVAFAGLTGQPEHTYEHVYFTWIPAGSFHVDVGILFDPLSSAMILFVTGVGALIHLYSIGYMHGDPRFARFFCYLNLFAASMLVLVLGDNLLLTFLGWEGVGACSYFLISFWFEKEANASAGKKAFVTNRVGDWGFMVAMFATFVAFGSIRYSDYLPVAGTGTVAQTTLTIIAVMLFVGAVGKSAQIPLFIWLPDAMAGPTPVSALIHAATMVTAGVYLMTRNNLIIFGSAEWVPWLIAGIGAATAFVAATIALAQTDIKKVLAYSTVSQLGYMFLAVGVGGYAAAIFHMITHAFFKALLFLGSGSVIHGMGGEQDMRKMGALRKVMPITAVTFIIGWLSIAGVPPFSGFWSKDDILTYASQKSWVLYGIGLFTALITAYYMSRQVYLVFYGDKRWGNGAEPVAELAEGDDGAAAVPAAAHAADDHGHGVDVTSPDFHPHESPLVMTIPLMVLAVLSMIGGVINLPFGDTGAFDILGRWLEPVVGEAQAALTYDNAQVAMLMGISAVIAVAGIFVAKVVYLDRKGKGAVEPEFFAKGWYYDSSLAAFMGGPGRAVFDGIAWFDRTVVDGAVNGVGFLVRSAGDVTRKAQSGYVRRYALGIAVGSVLLLAFAAARVLV